MFRKNVASQFIHLQGVDATTGGIKSGVSWTVRRCIDGTFAAGGGTVTEDGTTGWYKYAMSQADTNGNDIGFNFTGTGAVPQTINIITTAADPTVGTNFGLSALPTANPGASGGVLIAGTNVATTIQGLTLAGVAASGATPATAGLTATGGAASTTGGGVSAPAISATGGAGAASTNGAAAGATLTAGGTTTVSGNDGATFTATGNGNGMMLAKAGTGKDFFAQTTNALQVDVNTIKTNPVANAGTVTFPTNATLASTTNITAGTITSVGNVTGTIGNVTNIATAVWQDATASDFTTASSIGKSLYTNGNAPGAANGFLISGTNSGTVTFSDGVVIQTTGLNALLIQATAANANGVKIIGIGTGDGIVVQGGNGATGNGITITSRSTNGNAISATGTGTGKGALFTGGDGAGGDGVKAAGGSGNSTGIRAVGGGSAGAGILAAATAAAGNGMELDSGNAGVGLSITGGAHGIYVTGGVGAEIIGSSGAGVGIASSGGGAGMYIEGGSDSPGLWLISHGNGSAVYADGGSSTGDVIDIEGGPSGGRGIVVTTGAADGIAVLPTAGHALVLTANGTSKHGAIVTGGTAGTSDGAKFVAGTGGVDIRGNLTGILSDLTVTTYAEPGQGAPAATATIGQKIGYIFKAWRNKSTQTASEYDLYNDDAATVDQKSGVSDDGTTFTRNEIVSGP